MINEVTHMCAKVTEAPAALVGATGEDVQQAHGSIPIPGRNLSKKNLSKQTAAKVWPKVRREAPN